MPKFIAYITRTERYEVQIEAADEAAARTLADHVSLAGLTPESAPEEVEMLFPAPANMADRECGAFHASCPPGCPGVEYCQRAYADA